MKKKQKYDIMQHFRRETTSSPLSRWGFYAPELPQLAYAAFTALLILFTWTKLDAPSDLLWQRLNFLSGTLALWVVYRLWPCRFVTLCRVAYLLIMLSYWYPDTYELNRHFTNYDPTFAAWDQQLFGMQPALWFSRIFSSAWVSELMYMGYFSYYLFFACTTAYVYFRDFRQLERVSLIIIGSFFACYVVYDLLPVTGPQYYFPAVGIATIESGALPSVGDYFVNHSDAITSPGWSSGLFYHLVEFAHNTGERPTAAFPSSHVAVATVVMLICSRLRMWRWLLALAVPYIFLCLSTVYIMAHYAVDAMAGLVVGVALFFLFGGWKLQKIR